MSEVSPQALGERLRRSIHEAFVGNTEVISLIIIGMISDLNVLVEDIPGVGKTTLARSLAAATGMDFARIQFSPDLLPGDVTGTTIWSQEKREFVFKPGAVLHQFVLADELNRASARTQSALLETMQERSVTVDGVTYPLPQPFFLVATQNPVQFSGTFVLPEAQLDRFGVSFSIGYPPRDGALGVLDRLDRPDSFPRVPSVIAPEQVTELRERSRAVYVDAKIKEFIVAVAEASRRSKDIRLGVSPRATQHLLAAARGHALLDGRDFTVPEDVARVSVGVLRHRLVISPEARVAGKTADAVVGDLLDAVPMPTGLSP